jgi:hypothetical protein
MITKADRYEGRSSPIDAANVELTAFIGQLNTSVPHALLRTSVTGQFVKEGDPPPPLSERTPRDVVKAYAWLVDQALSRPEKLNAVIPVASKTPAPAVVVAPVFTPELRRVTEQSGARGRPICDCSDDVQRRLVAFVLEDGSVTEVTVPMRTGAAPTENPIGVIADLDVPLGDLQGEYVGGEILLGARLEPKCLWLGKKGDLRKTTFSLDIFAWSAVTARRIIGIDKAGRVHSLRLSGDRWQATDTVDDLAPAGTTGGACQVVGGRSVWVGVGDTVVSVVLEADDRLGPRSPPASFPGAASFVGNRRGLLFSVVPSGAGHVAGVFDGATYHELGPAASATIAVARDGNLASWLGPDGRLAAALITSAERTLLSELAATHPDGVEALCWTAAGEALVALFDERTWAVFMPKGVGR